MLDVLFDRCCRQCSISTLPDKSRTSWTYDSLRRNNKIIYTPKEGAADGKKLYTVLKYEGAELVTADGKNKKATTGIVNRYVNKFGSSGKAVNDLYYQYDPWGNITKITDQTVFEQEDVYISDGEELSGYEGDYRIASYNLLPLNLQFFADTAKRQTPDQKALLDLANESAKKAKIGNPISHDEAKILDEWAKEFNVHVPYTYH